MSEKFRVKRRAKHGIRIPLESVRQEAREVPRLFAAALGGALGFMEKLRP